MNAIRPRRKSGARPSRLRTLLSFWQGLPAKEKNTYTAISIALCIAIYFGLIWPLGHTRLGKIEYAMEKQGAREKSLAKTPNTPEPPPPSLGGKNLTEARHELEALRQQLEVTQKEVTRLNGSFVPLDDTLALNVLKTGLTNLAESGDMEVLALEHVYLRVEDKDRPPTPQMIKEAAQANPFKRPLIVMRARASYRGLMQFLDGLADLPYVAAPVSSDISVQVDRNPQTGAPLRQWLEVQIRFAV
ncbi:hypothetical protein [Rhodocyclus tenuis]|uniref:Uncharacterized protein n=1 Tax=Rhodocyclus tenuis TaxID=1066 RepID=A0A840G8N8_RHOTE|nr:hypothetical protein [Rhodocyclus tenuis]MBB4248703.1 hypothetical protein [Rhodocyclus tenuis]MBK1680876.1 hypothetical protein [Rhodocyclus tenuis]